MTDPSGSTYRPIAMFFLHVRLIGRFRLLASRPDPTTRVNATYRLG